jgi:hypothetical protein
MVFSFSANSLRAQANARSVRRQIDTTRSPRQPPRINACSLFIDQNG